MTATSGPSAPEQVEPVRPHRIGPHLVDLVDRYRVTAEREGGGTGEDHAPAVGQFVGQQVGHVGARPTARRA